MFTELWWGNVKERVSLQNIGVEGKDNKCHLKLTERTCKRTSLLWRLCTEQAAE